MKRLISILKTPVALPADPPEWWQIVPYGQIYIAGEASPLIMDDEGASAVLQYFGDLGRDMVIDYEHQTLKDVQAPAAGWIKEFQWRGLDGLWVRTEWTEKGAAYIAAREYRYFSPVMFSRRSDRRIVAIVNVALTNEPKTRNIAAIAAKLNPLIDQPKESVMLKKLAKLFGLGDDADEAAVTTAAEAIAAKNTELQQQIDAAKKINPVACKGIFDALKLSADTDEKTVVAKINSLSVGDTAAEDLARQVGELSGKIADMEAEKLTATALKNGQTSPEELQAWGMDLARTDPEKYKKIVLSRKPGSVIPVQKAKVVDDVQAREIVDDAQAHINKMMGIDEETYKKYNKI
ncbi:MAG: hypothetical protein APR55_07100 [Methanolinea sp. SDB]|nr:MAG: hypothetical protein APR55_07100 [Methanolinea sp. SDB]